MTQPKRFKRRLEDSLFTVPEADLSTLASMASPLHQRIVFVNPPSVLFDDADGTSAYDRDSIESWSAPPPAPFIPQFPQSKNTTQSWMHACLDAVDAMMRMPGGRDFSTPVDATALGLHDYFQVVTHPMDLGTVRSKLASKAYTVADEFVHDVRRTFSNCVLYNSLDSPIGAKAAKIWSMFCTRWFPVIDGFTPGLVVPWDEDGSFNTAFDSQTWDEQPPPIVMRELYWTCLLGNDGQCIGPDELEHHENHVLYGYLKKEDEKAVAPAPIALKNCREVRFEGYDWLYEYHPTCPGRRAILRFWIQATDFVWYRLSTPAPSYFPTYWLAVRRSLIVSRASICLSSFPSAGLDDLVAMMQGRYTPPNVKSNAKGNQAAAMLKVATDWKALTPYLASIAVFPSPSTDEIVAMYERFTDSLATCFNVNSKFNASSNAACSAIERKYKQLLKKLSEVDAFPPPDVVDLAVDVLAEPDDRTKTPGSGGRGRPKVPKEESNEGEVKEKKKRGRKKGSTLHKDSDKSKKSDGDASEPKRRRSEDSTEGAPKKRRRRRSSSEMKEEKSKSGVEGEKRKRDRKAEKERRDALKLAEFGGSLAEVKLTDEQRRERDALAYVLFWYLLHRTLIFDCSCRYKPKIPVEKLSEETRARHEELAQALRQVRSSKSPIYFVGLRLMPSQQFVSASRADNETRRQVANVISSIIATIERRDETEKRSEERRKKLVELKIQQQLQHDDVKVQKEVRGVLMDMCTDVESIHKKREELEVNFVGWCDDLYIAPNWGADFVARSHAVHHCNLNLRGKTPPTYPFGQPSGPSNMASIDTLCAAISSFIQFLRRLLSPKTHHVVQQEDLLRLPPARPEDVRGAVASSSQPPVWWAEVHMLALRVLYDERQLNLGDPLLAEVPVTPLTWPTMTSLAVLNMRDEMHGRVGDDLRAAADIVLLKGYVGLSPLQRCSLIMFLFDCLIETDRFADYFLSNRDTVISQQEALLPVPSMFDAPADRRDSIGGGPLYAGSNDSPVAQAPGEKVSKQPPQLLAWWSNRLYVKFADLFPDYSPVNLSNLRGSPIASGALQALPIGEYAPLGMDRFYDQYWATRDTTGELRVVILRQERSGSDLVSTVSGNAPKDLLHIGISVNHEDCNIAATFTSASHTDVSRPSKKGSQGGAFPQKMSEHPGSVSGSMWTIETLNDLRQLESWLLPTGYREGSLKAAMRDIIEAKLAPTPHPPRVSVSSGEFLSGNWPLQRADANGGDVAAVLDLLPPMLLSFGEPSGGGGCICLPKLTASHKLTECIDAISQLPTAVLCDNLPAEWRPRRGKEEEGGHLADWFDAIANCTSIGELMLYVDLFATMVVNVNAPHLPEIIPSLALWCKGFSGCSYIPAVGDDVMYSRTGHIRHLNVLKRQPWDVPVDLRSKTGLVRIRVLQDPTPGVSGLPKELIARCTVEAVDLCKATESKLPNFARVVLRITGTDRRLLVTYHLGVALPDFIIPYTVYSATPFCTDDACESADPIKVWRFALLLETNFVHAHIFALLKICCRRLFASYSRISGHLPGQPRHCVVP